MRPGGEPLRCEVVTGNTTGDPGHIRRIGLDGTTFDIGGTRDADGVYCTTLTNEDETLVEADLMRVLIREFLAGESAADAQFGLENLRWLLQFLPES